MIHNEYIKYISKVSDPELIRCRIVVDKELGIRSIKFSVGEIGEKILIDFFNTTPGLSNLLQAPTGAKNVDALSRDGDRYSIKTIQKGNKTGTIYPDSENKDKQLFEYLLLAKLDADYELKELYRFSWSDFLKVKAWDKRMNAWYIPVSQSRLEVAEKLY